jgi:prolyl oligopeptidase
MTQPSRPWALGAVFAMLGTAGGTRAAEISRPPATREERVVETLHGVEVADPYRWLEDQAAPATRAWIDAENAYTQSILERLPGKQPIQRRLGALIKIDVFGVPFGRGGRTFFSKRNADQDLFVLYVRRARGAADEVLLDPHGLSADHTVSVSFADVSVDGGTLVYAVRNGGEDEVTLKTMDVDTRRPLPDVLPRARYYGAVLDAGKTALYYSRQTSDGPRVFRHAMGADPAADEEVFGRGYGPEKIVAVSGSDDGRWLVIEVHHGSVGKKVEVYVLDLRNGGPVVTVVNDLDARFDASIGGDRLYLLTNWNAPRFRVMSVPLADPRRERWKEIVPETTAVITDIAPVGGHLLVRSLEHVQPRLAVHDADGRALRNIETPGIGAVGTVTGDWGEDEAFFSFSALAQPPTIYRYRLSTGRSEVWARQNVPIRSQDVAVEQVWYASKDGTKVPMFVAHRKGLRLDGSHPALLTGYGGFSLSQLPSFSARAAYWIGEAASSPFNLRGGGEFGGVAWADAGRAERLLTTIAAAGDRPQVHERVPAGDRGTVTGACSRCLHPASDLFRAVVLVPLLDMLRYHRFLVASYWVPEYGSADGAAQFSALRAYSPYHHVKRGERYPAVLFITGDGDTRVAPLHARKMAALLQASTGSVRPLLLHYDTKAGHSGGLPEQGDRGPRRDALPLLAAGSLAGPPLLRRDEGVCHERTGRWWSRRSRWRTRRASPPRGAAVSAIPTSSWWHHRRLPRSRPRGRRRRGVGGRDPVRRRPGRLAWVTSCGECSSARPARSARSGPASTPPTACRTARPGSAGAGRS